MREIKFKYVMKANDRVKISKPFTLEQIDDISCMFEEVAESFLDDCKDIGHTQSTCECFDDFWDEGEIINRLQFTGLLDKQGVEIYEGDIVLIFDSDFPDDDDKTAWQIKHLNGTFVMFYSNIDYYYLNANIDSFMCSFPSNWEIEVIGNIYENKELLEK